MSEALFTGPVLLLDNNELAVRALERYLTLLGIAVFSFVEAHTCIAGYQNLRQQGIFPQVALLDGALGGDLTGVDVAREIAAIDVEDRTALIAYTSYSPLFLAASDDTARIIGVIDKTDEIELLIDHIETILKKRQLATHSQSTADKP